MSSELKVQAAQVIQFESKQKSSIRSSDNNSSESSRTVRTANHESTDLAAGKQLPNSGETVPQVSGDSNVKSEADAQTLRQTGDEEKENAQKEDVLKVVQNLNEIVQDTRRELQFSVDDEAETIVVRVLDVESQEVIRQIPAEEVLELARKSEIRDEHKGQLFQIHV